MFDLSRVIFIDHHAHSLLKDHVNLDAIAFRQAFSESRSIRLLENHLATAVPYLDMLNKLAQYLDLKGGESEILEMRSRLARQDYVNLLFDDASIGCFILDDGFLSDKLMSIQQFAELSQRPVFHCVRIESVLEQCLMQVQTFNELERIFTDSLIAGAGTRKVALKSIVAYRGGLEIDMISREQARVDFDRARKPSTAGGTRLRITRGALYHYFLAQAFQFAASKNMPVQLHCGLGDQDADLRQSNPLCFRNILQSTTFSKTDFVFLHCFPFVKEAAFLASIYGNVYLDISLGPTLASPLAGEMFKEALSVAPSSKVLAATDGHSVPETYWFAVTTIRRALEDVLEDLCLRRFLDEEQAMLTAARVMHGNARSLYQLDGLK